MYLVITLITIVLILLEWFLNSRSRAKSFWQLPGLTRGPILGNGWQLLRKQVQIFKDVRGWAKQFHKEGLYRIWIWPNGQLSIFNPTDIETVLSSSKYNNKAFTYDFLKPWLRSGLLISEGDHWFERRKLLTPAFHFKILKHFTMIMEENSIKLVKSLQSELNKDKTDVIPIAKHYTLDVISETAMGTKLDDVSIKKRQSYEEAIEGLGKFVIERLCTAWLWLDCVFNIFPQGWKQKQLLRIVQTIPQKIINERRAYRKDFGSEMLFEGSTNTDEKENIGKKRIAMLDLLLTAEKEGFIDHSGISEEVDTFMFEGHDTTAAGITFALFVLATHKEVQDKIVEECQSIFGDSNRPATMQDLVDMKYLERCIKEVMRLYPPVPYMGRKIPEEVKFRDYTIPAGTQCHIHIFDLHRRPDLYPDPEVFDPERFTLENCEGRHPYAYIPFSAGPRNCIGQRFAMLEMKSVIQAILREYELHPVTRKEELVYIADLVLRTNHPIYVKITKRNKLD